MEVIKGYSDFILRDILTISSEAEPESWRYSDAEEYYGETLRNENTIHILLRRNQRPIGYLLAIPHNDAVQNEELQQADPELAEDPDRLYIETMEIVPEYGRSLVGGRLFLLMSKALLDEAGKRGFNKFSQHARVTSGLSRAFQKQYGDMVTQVRRIENWPFYNCEEPTEYIEGTYACV